MMCVLKTLNTFAKEEKKSGVASDSAACLFVYFFYISHLTISL